MLFDFTFDGLAEQGKRSEQVACSSAKKVKKPQVSFNLIQYIRATRAKCILICFLKASKNKRILIFIKLFSARHLKGVEKCFKIKLLRQNY